MKRYVYAIIVLSVAWCGAQPLKIKVGARKHSKMSVEITFVGEHEDAIQQALCKDLAFGGQLSVTHKTSGTIPTKQEIKKVAAQGIPLALIVHTSDDDKALEWRIFDTKRATMVAGKRVYKKGPTARGWVHAVADSVLPSLTGHTGCCSSRIAYRSGKGMLCVQDVTGGERDILVPQDGKIRVCPRWNAYGEPKVYFSEYTKRNVELRSVDLNNHMYKVLSFDGINMQPSISRSENTVVYTRSTDHGSQLWVYVYDKDRQRGLHRPLTNNRGNNLAPTLLENGDLLFCSDFQTKAPQVYYHHRKGRKLERITPGGYCACPAHCAANNMIVYGKIMSGCMQLFTYNPLHQTHEQLTFDAGNKEEPVWSPCGNYVAFSHKKGGINHITVMNLLTKQRTEISPADEDCTYPSWSPRYEEFPVKVS